VPLDSSVRDIVNMATIAAVDAQRSDRDSGLTEQPAI
jgi:hypothetical protein